MSAQEFLMDYLLNHPDNHNIDGEPFTTNLVDFFIEIGSECIWNEKVSSSRWWDNYFLVTNINGRLIGYNWAFTTGDDSAFDKGWEFDENSICFVEPYTEVKTITKYRPIPK